MREFSPPLFTLQFQAERVTSIPAWKLRNSRGIVFQIISYKDSHRNKFYLIIWLTDFANRVAPHIPPPRPPRGGVRGGKIVNGDDFLCGKHSSSQLNGFPLSWSFHSPPTGFVSPRFILDLISMSIDLLLSFSFDLDWPTFLPSLKSTLIRCPSNTFKIITTKNKPFFYLEFSP